MMARDSKHFCSGTGGEASEYLRITAQEEMRKRMRIMKKKGKTAKNHRSANIVHRYSGVWRGGSLTRPARSGGFTPPFVAFCPLTT
jgi:hypothetical protein